MIDQKQLENVDYFQYLGTIITDDARCTLQIISKIAMEKAPFSMEKTYHQQTGLILREEIGRVLHLEHSFTWC
jgi:hypothetical protein